MEINKLKQVRDFMRVYSIQCLNPKNEEMFLIAEEAIKRWIKELEEKMLDKKYDEDSELLINLLVGCLEEEDYEVLRFNESKKYSTTAYDELEVKRFDGVYFNISIGKRETFRNPRIREIEEESKVFNYLKMEVEE